MNFTYDQMVAAIRYAKETGKDELNRIWETARTLRFYGFIDESTYDIFIKEYTSQVYGE